MFLVSGEVYGANISPLIALVRNVLSTPQSTSPSGFPDVRIAFEMS